MSGVLDRSVVEASELNLAPGEWPLIIEYHGVAYNQKEYQKSRSGELISVRYVSESGCLELDVLND